MAGLVVVLVALLGTPAAADESYPNRPIRLLVGFGAGGPTDITFRKLAELAGKHLGRPIVVENKPGAGATLAPSTMARMDKPDGYTIAAATAGLLRFPHIQKVDWHPTRDFTWIAGLGGYTFVLAVRSDSPFKTVADVVAYAKANPGKLSIGTAGAGTTMHLLAEAFAGMADIEITHVGFKSSSEAATNLIGGQTVAALDAVGSVLPFVESGSVRLLMSFDALPADWMPSVPTAKSLGYELVYPFGSNGASQAILDARVLAYYLAQSRSDPRVGLRRYEAERRETVAAVQLANRRQAGDVMAKVSALARSNAFDQAQETLQAVEQKYKRLAGFDVEGLNQRASWSVTSASAG